jgi:hypothetical protein
VGGHQPLDEISLAGIPSIFTPYREEAYGLTQYRQSAEEPRAKVRIALSDEAT